MDKYRNVDKTFFRVSMLCSLGKPHTNTGTQKGKSAYEPSGPPGRSSTRGVPHDVTKTIDPPAILLS